MSDLKTVRVMYILHLAVPHTFALHEGRITVFDLNNNRELKMMVI